MGIAFYSDTLRDSYGPGTVEGHGARWKNQDKCNAIPQEILGKQTSDGSDSTVEEILSACRSFTGAHIGATSETEGRVLAERVRAWEYSLAWTPGWSLKRPPSSLQ